jgi:hypothetical protein
MLMMIVIHVLQALAPPLAGYGAGIGWIAWKQKRYVRRNAWKGDQISALFEQAVRHPLSPAQSRRFIEESTQRATHPDQLTRQEVQQSVLIGLLVGGVVTLLLSFL